MLAISLPGALFVLLVTAAAVGLIATLLAGAPDLQTRSLRASATPVSDVDASGSDPPEPRPVATPEHPDP